MSEPTVATPTPAAPAQEPTTGTPQETPPWGADFDPARAWHTITQLRAREAELAKQPRLSAEQQQQLTEYQRLVEASQTEAERQQNALAAAQREVETTRADAIRYKAAATFGIPAEHFDLLGSGSEEEISARAEKVRALLTAQAAAAVTPPAGAPQTRPVEQLRGGATPAHPASEDDVIYSRLFGNQAS